MSPTIVKVKSDSMATLGAIEKGRSSSLAMNCIARELAFAQATAGEAYAFDLQHIAGDRNAWADALSRLHQPGAAATVPGPLRGIQPTEVPERGPTWWRTLAMPRVHSRELEDQPPQAQPAEPQA